MISVKARTLGQPMPKRQQLVFAALVLISVGQASSTAVSQAPTSDSDISISGMRDATASLFASSSSIVADGTASGAVLFTEFAAPASTTSAVPSKKTAASQHNHIKIASGSAATVDEQLNVLTEKVINFDTESTAPPLNELRSGSVAHDPANGRFRIKIAEIITDEFDNGLSPAASASSDARSTAEAAEAAYDRRRLAYNQEGKIKLTDLYPSKQEDFAPIIRQSNERLINEKHVFVQDDGQRPELNEEELRGHVVLNSYEPDVAQSRVLPSTKIEIELIDDMDEPLASRLATAGASAAGTAAGKVSDFTRELLRDNDGIINTIERSFVQQVQQRRVAADLENEKIGAIGSVNRALDAGELIERRVKKLDPAVPTPKHVEVENVEEHSTKEKPEFSTTKFYNSKELYSELLQKKLEDEDTVSSTIRAEIATESQAIFTSTAEPSTSEVIVTAKSTQATTKPLYINTSKGDSNKAKKMLAKKVLNGVVKATLTKGKPATKPAPNTTTALPAVTTIDDESSASLATAKERPPTALQATSTSQPDHKKPTIPSTDAMATIEDISTTSNIPAALAPVSSTTIATTSPTTSVTTEQWIIRNAATIRSPNHVKTAPAQPQLSRLQERLIALECDLPPSAQLPNDVNVWHGNETHQLILPITIPEKCSHVGCMPMVISWEGFKDIQTGDVLIVEIDDSLLVLDDNHTNKDEQYLHKATTSVYQVTRPGHEHCDITEGVMLDITPLEVDGKKLVTLYEKDLAFGENLLIVVSELWGSQCVRLRIVSKTEDCGEGANCLGKGVCYANKTMETYECRCCNGFLSVHCEEIDACTPSPCTNNGICVDLSQGQGGREYSCLCPYGYDGKNCQFEIDPCNPSECQNGGSCNGNSTHFRCDCAPGFDGPRCENSIGCASRPCLHGICVDQASGYRCFCEPGFAGQRCNFEYNECESNPCLNGGQCADHIGGFACKCTNGYEGKRCQIKVDFCANNPCPEGHRCNDHGDEYTCECPGGRNGPDCNQVPRTLCNVNPCANGGTCWTSEQSFYCACRPGYTGKMCEDEFIVETVVSSNEMLSDDTMIVPRPFGESSYSARVAAKEHSGADTELHKSSIVFGTCLMAVMLVIVLIVGTQCRKQIIKQTYLLMADSITRGTTKPTLPTFAFSRRSAEKQAAAAKNRHWLSGKGVDRVLTSRNMQRNQSVPPHLLHKSAASAEPFNSTGAALQMVHEQQMYQQQQHQQKQLHLQQSQTPATCQQRPQQRSQQNDRHLSAHLDNELFYAADFSESQQSPLID